MVAAAMCAHSGTLNMGRLSAGLEARAGAGFCAGAGAVDIVAGSAAAFVAGTVAASYGVCHWCSSRYGGRGRELELKKLRVPGGRGETWGGRETRGREEATMSVGCWKLW